MNRTIALVCLVVALMFACTKHEPESGAVGATSEVTTDAGSAAPPASTASAEPRACSYLSTDDAGTLLGHPVKEREGNDPDHCTYDPADDDFAKGATLDFKISTRPVMYEGLSGMARSEQVSGVGEKAVWSETLGQLAFVKGGREGHVTVAGFGGKPEKVKAAALEAAKTIAEKL